MNVCVGLGAGLLLGRYRRPVAGCRRGRPSPRPDRLGLGLDRRLDPVALGMIFALALMISSMVFCLSRGGFLALLGGSILGLVIRLPRIAVVHAGEARPPDPGDRAGPGRPGSATTRSRPGWRPSRTAEDSRQRLAFWSRALPRGAGFPPVGDRLRHLSSSPTCPSRPQRCRRTPT